MANCFFIGLADRKGMYFSKDNNNALHCIHLKQPYNNEGFLLKAPLVSDFSEASNDPTSIVNFYGTGVSNEIVAWQSGFSYKKGDIVYTGANDTTDTHYICVYDGVSGATAPSLTTHKIIEQPDVGSSVKWIYAPFLLLDIGGQDKKIKYQFNGSLPKVNAINQPLNFALSNLVVGVDEVNNQIETRYDFEVTKAKNSRINLTWTISVNSATGTLNYINGFYVYSDWSQDPNLANGFITLDYGAGLSLRPQIITNEYDIAINSLDFNANTYRGSLQSIAFAFLDENGHFKSADFVGRTNRIIAPAFDLRGVIYNNGLNIFDIVLGGTFSSVSGAIYTKNTTLISYSFTKEQKFQLIVNDDDYGKRRIAEYSLVSPLPSNWKLIPISVVNNTGGEQIRRIRKYYHQIL